MNAQAIDDVLNKLQRMLAGEEPHSSVAIIGRTAAAFELVSRIRAMGLSGRVNCYAHNGRKEGGDFVTDPRSFSELLSDRPAFAVIAGDAEKEDIIADCLPYLTCGTRILIGGYEHFKFRDSVFSNEVRGALIPSLANGYPNCLIHIYQCLQNAARLDLQGVIAEFGMFKGGTTLLMSRFAESLGRDWKVYGFDTFGGFPPPKSPLDMYSHPDCVYLDVDAVRAAFKGRNVEIVQGDVTETVSLLAHKDVVLSFVDTDNFTAAKSVLDVIADRVVVGGAIVFDHFAGTDKFLYTLGERLAAKRLLDDNRFFNLHDTGVFLRLR